MDVRAVGQGNGMALERTGGLRLHPVPGFRQVLCFLKGGRLLHLRRGRRCGGLGGERLCRVGARMRRFGCRRDGGHGRRCVGGHRRRRDGGHRRRRDGGRGRRRNWGRGRLWRDGGLRDIRSRSGLHGFGCRCLIDALTRARVFARRACRWRHQRGSRAEYQCRNDASPDKPREKSASHIRPRCFFAPRAPLPPRRTRERLDPGGCLWACIARPARRFTPYRPDLVSCFC